MRQGRSSRVLATVKGATRRNLLLGLAAASTGCALPPARSAKRQPAPVRVENLGAKAVGGDNDRPGGWPLPFELQARVWTSRPIERADHLVVALMRGEDVIEETGGVQLQSQGDLGHEHLSTVSLSIAEPGDYTLIASDARGLPLRQALSVRRVPALWARRPVLVTTHSGCVAMSYRGEVTVALCLWVPHDEPRACRVAFAHEGAVVAPRIETVGSMKARRRASTMQAPGDLARAAVEAAAWRPFFAHIRLPASRVVPGRWVAHLDIDGFGGWRVPVMLDADGRPEGSHLQNARFVSPVTVERDETSADVASQLAERSAQARVGNDYEPLYLKHVSAAELRALTRSEEINVRRAELNSAMQETATALRRHRRRGHRAAAFARVRQVHEPALHELIAAHGHPWTDDELLF